MSTINQALPCWAPPLFPVKGRLQLSAEQVNANYKKQIRESVAYRNQPSERPEGRVRFACSQSLHISLFFDGTGNNERNDTRVAVPPHPTNIARMYHASIEGLDQGYFRYYIPGVGTPFPKINEFDYTFSGLAYACGGEDRINWALLRLVDALKYTLTSPHQRLEDADARRWMMRMRSNWPMDAADDRREIIHNLLSPYLPNVKWARPHLLNIKLFIYGFSRGAAEARTFVTWLTELFSQQPGDEHPQMSLLGLPLSIEFLGLLDTVASVGIAHVAPGASGHLDWASGTQQLPSAGRFPGLIKCCRHFIAAHEQRLSFPLDSVRRPQGEYPPATQEVVYPGMHSDVGGGYPPGEQGKSTGGVGELLSQIVLHDLYAAAFEAGAPLAVRPDLITPLIKDVQPSRKMSRETLIEFDISALLIKRFNIWRQTLTGTAADASGAPASAGEGYRAWQLAQVLESAISDQMAWLTAWRIGRYAHHSLLTQPFYLNAPQADAAGLQAEKERYDKQRTEILRQRQEVDRSRPDWQDQVLPGLPDFDPTNARYQLREAAREFEHDYQHWLRDVNGDFIERAAQILLDVIPKYPVYLLNGDDEEAEYLRMRREGDQRSLRLFSDRLGNATRLAPMSALVAFYDDQVHDSRAWFMQSTIGGREMWGGYFRYRMIYTGDVANKRLQLISLEGQVIGARTSQRVEYRVERYSRQGQRVETHQVRDLTDGSLQPVSPAQMAASVHAPGEATAKTQLQILIARDEAARDRFYQPSVQEQRQMS